MAFIVRLFTLLTIAAAGFAMPMTCAQIGSASAADSVAIEIPAAQQLEDHDAPVPSLTETSNAMHSLAERILERDPLDCGGKSTPRATDQPALFDTQPFVPGYLIATLQLEQQQSNSLAPPPPLVPIDSRAGPPDAPPPKSID